MAEDDIYGNQRKYENLKQRLASLAFAPAGESKEKYHCKNPSNLRHFTTLFNHVETRDLSFIRRLRLSQCLRTICHLTAKDLGECSRDDINAMVRAMHGIYRTPKSKETFIKEMKYLWKVLFPETDEKGRPDEAIVPYVVRHLSARTDKSREKERRDKFSIQQFEALVSYFGDDPRIQAYLTISLESLARPQELLYVRLGGVKLYDTYAKIRIGEHGKEGLGLLQCIDSYPFLLKWLSVHPLRSDEEAFLFVNTGDTNRCQQLRPGNINKLIRKACRDLGIAKPITCYSLKRNGVTIRRLRGDSDMEIQHAARWTSTKQLKIYDLSTQDEAFKRELEKRGLIPSVEAAPLRTKKCGFCGTIAGFEAVSCQQCARPLDRRAIVEEAGRKDAEIGQLRQQVSELAEGLTALRAEMMPALLQAIRAARRAEQEQSESPRAPSLPAPELRPSSSTGKRSFASPARGIEGLRQ